MKVKHMTRTRALYLKLKEYLVNTTGYTWNEEFDRSEDGQAAFQAWSNHYNGTTEPTKCTKLAKAELKSLHYRNEKYISFELFSGKVKNCYLIIKGPR